MNTENQTFKSWAIIELFGHQKIAGYMTEQSIGAGNMIRIDVPETKKQPAYTRFLGNAAIYAINPVDENIARIIADRLNVAPITAYDAIEALKKINPEQALAIEESRRKNEFEHNEDDEDERY